MPVRYKAVVSTLFFAFAVVFAFTFALLWRFPVWLSILCGVATGRITRALCDWYLERNAPDDLSTD